MPPHVAAFLVRHVESQLASVGTIQASDWYDVEAPVVEATSAAWRAALLSFRQSLAILVRARTR